METLHEYRVVLNVGTRELGSRDRWDLAREVERALLHPASADMIVSVDLVSIRPYGERLPKVQEGEAAE